MNPPFNAPNRDPEECLEAWLTSQPLTPAPDFVARTLARIHTEATLVTAARAGDEAAIDALLDRWLGEQTIEADFEPAQLATSTRRAATLEKQKEGEPEESNWRRVIAFPAWARSAIALAAAACVALLGYFNLHNPAGNLVSHGGAQTVAASPVDETSSDSFTPAPYAWNSDPNYISELSNSVKDLAPAADSNDLDTITQQLSNDDVVN